MAVGVANPNVQVFVYDWKGRSFVRAVHDAAAGRWLEGEMHLYLEDLEDTVLAHEFGHIFGNPDEYALTATEYLRITGTAGTAPAPVGGQTAKGLMGSHYESTQVHERFAAPALHVINAVRDVAKYPDPFLLLKR
jgi:hypothetical protein